ncbi:MAG: kynureninase [Phycisphaerales bacterium]|nr:kynureninase [Phycisphaerales bacterium]
MTQPSLIAHARNVDGDDPLAPFRSEFEIPAGPEGRPCVYLTGNSLGLMPRATRAAVAQELDDWARLGVEGHFHAAHPWFPYHEDLRAPLASLVGADEREVVAMGGLTTNLHLLMVSFYSPTRERPILMIEEGAFPSDRYAAASQVALHGFDPGTHLVRLRPRPGEYVLRTEDIVREIEIQGSRLALVMLGAVNYLTGQLLDMPAISRAAHRVGARCGWDCAHAAGNVPLRLHDCGADFGAWCSYKYLNAGPGATAGLFVHERHLGNRSLPRLAGWWGNDPASRFSMPESFVPVDRADAWAHSNPPILATAPLRVSLEMFSRAGIGPLRARSERLTGFLEREIRSIPGLTILTPPEPSARGCQLSLVLPGDARSTHQRLLARGFVCDFREPNVVRASPVPLYNSFEDVARFALALREECARG